MPALVSVLDTNAYIALSPARVAALLARERSQGVIAVAAHHAMFELVTGSLNADERHAAKRFAGLTRLYQHCSQFNGSHPVLRDMVYSDAQAAHDLLGRHSDDYELYGSLLGRLIHWQVTSGDRTWGDHRAVVETLRDDRDERERRFSDTLFTHVVRGIAPDARGWQDVTTNSPLRTAILAKAAAGEGKALLGRSIAIRAARHVGITLSDPEIDSLARRARAIYPVPVALLDNIIQAIILNGRDMARPEHANSLWDYEISFCVADGTHVDGAPVHLITTDRGILDAAAQVGAENVRSLEAYEQLLDLPYEDFRAVVDLRPAAR